MFSNGTYIRRSFLLHTLGCLKRSQTMFTTLTSTQNTVSNCYKKWQINPEYANFRNRNWYFVWRLQSKRSVPHSARMELCSQSICIFLHINRYLHISECCSFAFKYTPCCVQLAARRPQLRPSFVTKDQTQALSAIYIPKQILNTKY